MEWASVWLAPVLHQTHSTASGPDRNIFSRGKMRGPRRPSKRIKLKSNGAKPNCEDEAATWDKQEIILNKRYFRHFDQKKTNAQRRWSTIYPDRHRSLPPRGLDICIWGHKSKSAHIDTIYRTARWMLPLSFTCTVGPHLIKINGIERNVWGWRERLKHIDGQHRVNFPIKCTQDKIPHHHRYKLDSSSCRGRFQN